MRHTRALLPVAVALSLGVATGPDRIAVREEAYRANNVGVGLLEQYLYDGAAAAFRRALEADPGLVIARVNLAVALYYAPDAEGARKEAEAVALSAPTIAQPHYILGLVAKGQDRLDDAVTAFQKVLVLDPTDVGANVNLGQIYLQQRRYPDALAALRAAVESDPFNSSALYNLGIALTRAGQTEEGRKVLKGFEALRKSGVAIVFGQTYPDQGRYAEALVSTGAEPELVDSQTPAVGFVDATAAASPGEERAAGSAARPGRVTLVDLDGDGDLDLVEVGDSGQRLLRNDGGRFVDVTKAMGLDPAASGLGAAAGDVDNDGKPDLLVLRKKGVTLHHNDGEKGFSDITAAAGILPGPAAVSAALVDVDHDGDLDAVLAGTSAADRLLRNDGKGLFTDVTSASGLAGPRPDAIAVAPTDFDNHRDVDLVVVNAAAPPMLFKNLRDGSFRDVATETGLAKAEGRFLALAVGDVNKDGFTDFFLGRAKGGDLLALSDGRRGFAVAPGPGSEGATSAQFLDYDNDGLLDIVTLSRRGLQVFRNVGAGRWVDVTAAAVPKDGAMAESFAAGDVDGDGATDLVLRLPSGPLRFLRNEGGARNHSLSVRLAGRVSNRSGVGAKVEIRAGSLRQKLETSAATPPVAPADVLFGLGARGEADAVRVLWPAGILQTETDHAKIALRTARIEELDRKPSSCPFLYAWNGDRFEFVTDFMGGGEMGSRLGPGVWNTPIPEEYVRLDADQLRSRGGRYELRVTNELEESLFVDRLRLVAIAHPADVLVFPNEGMGTAPRLPLHLFTVRGAHPPARAFDDQGRDVLDRVARLDRRFVDGFALESIRGYAQDHALVLDVGGVPADRALLLLTGWTDYAFSSDNVAGEQRGLSLKPPALEMKDDRGRWVRVIDDIGIPVGRPQTVVVDLAGRWPGRSRLVRIATNMRIYWDLALVGAGASAPLRKAVLDPAVADLRDRGFSAEASPDGREPFGYDYARVSRVSSWKTFPGRYTRLGDVRELLVASDDVFVVSRPGDELALSFDAKDLPPLPAGWTRTFLLHADGFSKEMDINSATPDSLGPLPFHEMSRYPYAAPEAYPMTPEKLALLERYNTRVVTAPVAPLEAALARSPVREIR